MLNLVTGLVRDESMMNDLEILLDSIDADFTGTNGEEYYIDEKPAIYWAMCEAEGLECEQERIESVLESCKDYSSNYYDDFQYTVIDVDKGFEVVIATV